jgi:hypothetical protein
MKPEYLKWIGIAFVLGFLAGALLFPIPRYRAMTGGAWVLDTWTGKIESFASQQEK